MKTYINNAWQFAPEFDRQLLASKKADSKSKLKIVNIPHTTRELPYNYFSEDLYQGVCGYRKTFKTLASWKNRRVFITFEGAAHESTVYLNGQPLGTHSCGYTAFSYELTKYLAPSGSENVLVVKLDSNESLDVPPFGFVIDYMTYSGIYRNVYIEDKPQIFIEDVFVTTKQNVCSAQIKLSNPVPAGTVLTVEIDPWSKVASRASGTSRSQASSRAAVTSRAKTASRAPAAQIQLTADKESDSFTAVLEVKNAKLWSPETPSLYTIQVSLEPAGSSVPGTEKTVRFAFRDIEFNKNGFFLNGAYYKIRGLDRHQSFAYAGYAMPDSIQREDARILKYELGLNAVRTSHYPQSQSFIDACDELGLLVFTEIPGWQFIGSSPKWRKQAVQNTRDMVLQYRNHPSIILWGVRINESPDDDELYKATNEAAHALDPSRPTGGVRCIKKSHLFEDVYTYNDFVHTGNNIGCEPKKNVTSNMKKGYLISEYNGHMYPTKIFDDEIQRTNHAIRHARVLNDVAGHSEIAGSFGWCAFDYNTHEDFGSGDRICYHGVMDMFRNPKLASSVYKSQSNAEPVLEVSTSMDVGEHPACVRGKNWIFTNADSVKMYFNGIFITEYFPSKTDFPNLAHPPIMIDDFIGNRFIDELKMSPSASRDAKALINFVALNGQIPFPKSYYPAILRLVLKGFGTKKLTKLYNDYVGNWGGTASVYSFEAIKNGKVVAKVTKGPVEKYEICAECSSTELCQDYSWDAGAVRVSVKDQYGNVLPYFMESVRFTASGAVSLIGPEVSCFRGGCTGTYVRTNGKKGKGTLLIECGSLSKQISFTVR
ncbi:glycoside hydrolase family 2 protein [Treponema sp.]|uniref:glycoside hydrolase family 2 protein n=1 Tax=Treponema sp. TaxID=166 RepID=UPI00298EBCD1|nr:glycoside hydrolase family 2 TIM barrel-domain containing protein [Treponema sp.]MCR5614097.1 glycoside hydrolase family 2 protein [Treponema sp.]